MQAPGLAPSLPPAPAGTIVLFVLVVFIFIFILVILVFHRSIAGGLIGGLFAFLFYIPVGYYTDRMLYNRYQRRKQSARG